MAVSVALKKSMKNICKYPSFITCQVWWWRCENARPKFVGVLPYTNRPGQSTRLLDIWQQFARNISRYFSSIFSLTAINTISEYYQQYQASLNNIRYYGSPTLADSKLSTLLTLSDSGGTLNLFIAFARSPFSKSSIAIA